MQIFASFHKVYRDLQKYRYCRLPMTSLTSPHGVLYTTWSQKFFSAKQEKLISSPVKFQVHIISKSTFFLLCQKGGGTPPNKFVTPS